jgi:transposase
MNHKTHLERNRSAFGCIAAERPLVRGELSLTAKPVIQAPDRRGRIMRYELTGYEWTAIKPMLPNKPRGVPRVTTAVSSTASSGCCARGHHGETCRIILVRTLPAITASVRWRRAGVWAKIMNALAGAHDAAVQMIDTSLSACISTAAFAPHRVGVVGPSGRTTCCQRVADHSRAARQWAGQRECDCHRTECPQGGDPARWSMDACSSSLGLILSGRGFFRSQFLALQV